MGASGTRWIPFRVSSREIWVRPSRWYRLRCIPPDVLDKMFQTVMAARFVEYPSNYHEPPTNGFRFPAHYYFLDLRMDGVRHTVRWSEPVSPYTDAGLRLEQMFKSIIRIVEALPEVQRLPVPKDACL